MRERNALGIRNRTVDRLQLYTPFASPRGVTAIWPSSVGEWRRSSVEVSTGNLQETCACPRPRNQRVFHMAQAAHSAGANMDALTAPLRIMATKCQRRLRCNPSRWSVQNVGNPYPAPTTQLVVVPPKDNIRRGAGTCSSRSVQRLGCASDIVS